MNSQVQVIGLPKPKTWEDYEQGCLETFAGGHRNDGHLEAFQHGMQTVFNLLRNEFPPAEVCTAARDEGKKDWMEPMCRDFAGVQLEDVRRQPEMN